MFAFYVYVIDTNGQILWYGVFSFRYQHCLKFSRVYYHVICFKPMIANLLSQLDSTMSISISELRSDEYADKVLSSAQLWSDAFVMEKYKSFRKIWKSKARNSDPCGTPEISSNKVLYTLLIGTDCFLFLRYKKINQSDYLSKP